MKVKEYIVRSFDPITRKEKAVITTPDREKALNASWEQMLLYRAVTVDTTIEVE